MENPVRMKVHINFKDLCFKIQNDRIKSEVDNVQSKMSLDSISKMITNMINSNPKILEKLVEAKNGNA